MIATTIFHDGERAVQERAGESDGAERNARMVADEIPAGAMSFPEEQRIAVLTTVDAAGNVWASLAAGEPGFVRVADPRHIEIDTSIRPVASADPFWSGIYPGAPVGMLFLEPETRRRLRVNGRVVRGHPHVTVEVEEAYPNCRKYVQSRRRLPPELGRSDPAPFAWRQGTTLDAAHRRWIQGADTAFVASFHPERGADASHRGGEPGFLTLLGDRTILVPDYPGNSLFNTLGNLVAHPRCGLLLVDLERGRALQLTGDAEVLWDMGRPAEETGGTLRHWTFTVRHWVESAIPTRERWRLAERSSHNPPPPRP